MVDIDIALARLHLAADQSEALQFGLRHRQDDLLAMEKDIRLIAERRTTGRAVIDQAEDIRRAVEIYTTDHIPEIKVALDRASLTLAIVESGGEVSRDVAIRLGKHIRNATGESARASDHLEAVVDALRQTSQALPGEPSLAETAQASVDSAAARLDNARRATFRIVEDLPVIERALEEISLDETRVVQTSSMGIVTPEPRSAGQSAERLRPPDPGGRRSAGIAPER